MNDFRIILQDNKRAYHPGETVNGMVRPLIPGPRKTKKKKKKRVMKLILAWEASGYGNDREEVIKKISLTECDEWVPFAFQLPAGPYSCQGKLIHIHWFIKLVTNTDNTLEKLKIVLSPGHEPINLNALKSRNLPHVIS